MKSEHKSRRAMRVYITERCNAKCPNCFNAKTRSNKEMSLKDFEELCIYLNSNGIDFLKIMGGEPTIHNSFPQIIETAQKYFNKIAVFSNGTTDAIKNIKLREKDSVVYNFTFSKIFSKEKMYFSSGGERAFEVQVKKDTDEVNLIKQLIALTDAVPVRISLTLDCTANIFVEKPIVLEKLKYIEKELISFKRTFTYDHMIPLCYLYKTGLHVSNSCMCGIPVAGLISADFMLKFCNQHAASLISLKQDGKFIPWAIAENYLQKSYYEIRAKALDICCLNCVFFNKKCNGGCWIPKMSITKEDIMKNTAFPIQN